MRIRAMRSSDRANDAPTRGTHISTMRFRDRFASSRFVSRTRGVTIARQDSRHSSRPIVARRSIRGSSYARATQKSPERGARAMRDMRTFALGRRAIARRRRRRRVSSSSESGERCVRPLDRVPLTGQDGRGRAGTRCEELAAVFSYSSSASSARARRRRRRLARGGRRWNVDRRDADVRDAHRRTPV